MTTPDGEYITNETFQMVPNKSSYHWTHITKPTNKLCQLWISTIQNIFCEKRTNKILRQYKLGQWIFPPKKSHKIYSYYISPSTNAVYNTNTEKITSSLIITNNRMTITCDGDFCPAHLPEDISPILQIKPNTYKYQSSLNFKHIKQIIPRNYEQFVQKLPEYEKLNIENFTIINPEILCECVTNEKEITISTDGSYKSSSSGWATVITDKHENILVTGYNPDTGHYWFQCFFRSESQACLSAFIFLTQYCRYLNVPIPPSIYFCDNNGLIKKISNNFNITKHTTSKDIIRHLKKNSQRTHLADTYMLIKIKK